MTITDQQLDEILADFSALGRVTYLTDPALGFSHAATGRDDLGIPKFTPELPPLPVALIERHQALWTTPVDDTPRQEVWTYMALAKGMERITLPPGVYQLPNLDGWVIGAWPRSGGGLQLQQPDGNLFVYAPCRVPRKWLTAARRYSWVLVLHGPRLGLKVPSGLPDAAHHRAAEMRAGRTGGLVTGGLMMWGEVRKPRRRFWRRANGRTVRTPRA